MATVINDEINTGGYGYGGGAGAGGGILLLVVVLIVLFAAFGRGLGGRDGGHMGGDFGGHSCFPAATTPMTTMEMAKISRDQAVDTGAIIHALDVQTCDIEKGQAAIIQNQMAIAAAQERTFFTEKLADMREAKLCSEAAWLQKETALQGKISQQEILNTVNAQFCALNNRVTRIDEEMPHRPPFFAAGGTPELNFCATFPRGEGRREEGCCRNRG